MADAMQAAGIGPTIDYKSSTDERVRTYQFQAIRPQEIGRFEAWLERQAWEVVQRANWMPPAMLKELRDETRQDMAAQVYRYGGRAFDKAMLSSPGLKQIALISLKAGEGQAPEIDGELIDAMFKDKGAEMASALVGIGWLRRPESDADKTAGGPSA